MNNPEHISIPLKKIMEEIVEEQTELIPIEKETTEIKETCKDCKHRERWSYRSGATFQYCGKLSSNRTINGKKKIKCKDKACDFFSRDGENECCL